MYKNKADIERNRLYITFRGKMDALDIIEGGNNVIQEAKMLKPGFCVISDISQLTPTMIDGRQALKNTMRTLFELGIGKVIRVTGNNIIQSIWSETSIMAGYTAIEVTTIEEAEELLEKIEKGL